MAIRSVNGNMNSKRGRLHDTKDVRCLFGFNKVERIVALTHLDKILTRNES